MRLGNSPFSSHQLSSLTDATGDTWLHSYEPDANGCLPTAPSRSVSPTGAVTSFEYDAHGRVLTKVHPDGFRQVYEYASNGSLSKATGPLGERWDLIYATGTRFLMAFASSAGRTDIERSTEGRPMAMHDSRGCSTWYEYDKDGRIVGILRGARSTGRANGLRASLSYNALGQLLAITSPGGLQLQSTRWLWIRLVWLLR